VERAALYLRSSKDRKEVSIEVQRQDLRNVAKQRKLTVVEEFSDVVESGKDEDRPGFQRLIQAVRNTHRGWSTILVLDTSRLARRRLIALMFEEHECARYGVRVVYKTLPESMDEGMEVILKSQLQAMDEWHSITSRQKGLAGMAQNVKDGYRAGGRAPYGYRLEHTPTGTIREGAPVLKSKLELSDDAPRAQTYLRARAQGTKRTVAAREAGVTLSDTSLVGIEWNALTYAGHTVWNVHNEIKHGHYVGGTKRRPRKDWVIHRDTHPALITDDEANCILKALEAYSRRRPRQTGGKYLLTGMLRTPAGMPWYGESSRDCYRVAKGGRNVRREALETAVLGKVMGDLKAARFVDAVLSAARAAPKQEAGRGRELRARVSELSERIGRMMNLAAEMALPGPALRKVEELERERVKALEGLESWEATQAQYAARSELTAASVRAALDGLGEQLFDQERDQMKVALGVILQRVELDPESLDCRLHYRIGSPEPDSIVCGITQASPWGRHGCCHDTW